VRKTLALRGFRLTPKYDIFDRRHLLVFPVALRSGARLFDG
jgi:hypothetical protein